MAEEAGSVGPDALEPWHADLLGIERYWAWAHHIRPRPLKHVVKPNKKSHSVLSLGTLGAGPCAFAVQTKAGSLQILVPPNRKVISPAGDEIVCATPPQRAAHSTRWSLASERGCSAGQVLAEGWEPPW